MNYSEKRKVLYAHSSKDLNKQMEHLAKFSYVQDSDIKYFENDSKPYQVLVIKKWLVKEKKDGLKEVI